jgi:hypothetical protein
MAQQGRGMGNGRPGWRWLRPAASAGVAVAVAMTLSGGTAMAGPTAAPHWTLAISPDVNGAVQDNNLAAVSCAGTAFCMAVGDVAASAGDQTLTEKWNGTRWASVNSPNGSATHGSDLFAVSCTSARFCMAVGSFGNGTTSRNLVEKWNGSKWAKVTSPNTSATQPNSLDGVSCSSATFCMAVGSFNNGAVFQALAEKWNGRRWTLLPPPDSSAAQVNELFGVSCTKATFCMATGVFVAAAVGHTLAEKWNGTAWKLVTSPDPSAQTNVLSGVRCVSSAFCMAVGYQAGASGTGTLAEKWNGKSWALVTSADPSTSQASQLTAVSCSSSSFCTAVGYYFNGNVDQTLAEKWNGTNWSLTKSPNSSLTQSNWLYGVSCTSSSRCVNVGYYSGSTGNNQTLAERWNGKSWAKLSAQNVGGPSDNNLSGVSCAGTAFCMAVGDVAATAADQTLIEKWNGTRWATVKSPSSSSTHGTDLSDVSCVSAKFCMAVGSFGNGTVAQNWTEKWNGSKWAKVSAPDTSATQTNFLSWVSCVSATFCMAVGTASNGTTGQTLAEKWNGKRWTLLSTPDTSSTQDNRLSGVSCTSATFCLAVGLVNTGPEILTLAEKWNGKSWTLVTSADPATHANELFGVSCTSTAFCMAVGGISDGTTPEQTLIEKWNGSSLTVVTSANTTSAQSNELRAVTCTSTTFCMAVGSYLGTAPLQTLAQKWNGTGWTLVKSANHGTSSHFLSGLSCTRVAFCIAVGSYDNGGFNRTLIEHW